MKLKTVLKMGRWLPGLTFTIGLAPVTSALAQNYAIDCFTIAGGAGTSTGGAYSLSGTIGQPDDGRMTGGNYILQGGFWGVVAAEPPNALLLSIGRSITNTIIVSWPAPATGWQLQENANLNTTTWVNVTTVPLEIDGRKQVVAPLPTSPACKFYRLHKPN